MKKIGEVYVLKETLEEIRSELTPSFYEVIKSYLGLHVETRFKDPLHVIEATWLTPPLKSFLESVFRGLETPVAQGTLLIRGFGFGKTHALILLWHILNSSEGAESSLARSLGFKKRLAEETLVLGVDFSREDLFAQILSQLEAVIRWRDKWRIKDPRLVGAIVETLERLDRARIASISSKDLAGLVIDVLEKYKGRDGRPRLLLLVDELGIGIVKRLTSFIETGNEEYYLEIDRAINFIEDLYADLSGRGIPVFVVIALAQQDLREIDAIYLQQAGKPHIQERIDGLKKRLSILRERLSRAVGGFSEDHVVSYSPEHVVNIARHRVLRKIIDGRPEEELVSYVELQAYQYNLREVLDAYKEYIKSFYPLSPSMIWLVKKILDPIDTPRTEYVRTVIHVVAEAAENALKHDPGALSISTRHIPLNRVGLVDLMADLEADWASVVLDVEHSFKAMSPEISKTVDIVSKQILAKGATANVLSLIETRDLKELKRYGVTLEEMQLDILTTLPLEEAVKTISQLPGALEALKILSARVEEKEYDGQKFYIPSLMRTVYDKLAVFTTEQKKLLEEPSYIPIYLQENIKLHKLLQNPRALIRHREREVLVLIKDYNKVTNITDLLSDAEVRDAQNNGYLSLIIVPPWDINLFNRLYRRRESYSTLIEEIVGKLQDMSIKGKIRRPLHVVILLPNISPEKISTLIDSAISYAAIQRFLEYLNSKEKILEERLIDYEKMLQKRLTRRLAEFFKDQRERLLAGLKNLIEKQIRDARWQARKNLVEISRRLAMNVMELYEEAVFYSMQENRYISRNLSRLFGEVGKETERLEKDREYVDLTERSLLLNTFLGEVAKSLNYNWNPDDVAESIYRYYRTEFEKGVTRRHDRVEEIVENALLGVYDIKPLSIRVVEEAIDRLNGRSIELEGRTVKIGVDRKDRLIKFEVEEVKRVEEKREEVREEEIETPIRRPIEVVFIEIRREPEFEEFLNRFRELYSKTSMYSININIGDGSLRAILEFRGPGHELPLILGAFNFIKQLSKRYGLTPHVEIKFTEPYPSIDLIQGILGPFFTSEIKRSWDRVLPSG